MSRRMKKQEKNLKDEIKNPEREGKTETSAQEQTREETTLESLQARIADLEQSVSSYKDQLLRKAAEFENYKKRIENDFGALAKFSNEELITQLLPILDDFARSLKAGKENPESESFSKGVELIYNKFLKILEHQGVKVVESVGKSFDVYYHDALMEIPRDDVPHHTVIDEVEKGYTLHGKVIRHAKVILASSPQRLEQGGFENEPSSEGESKAPDPQQPTDGEKKQ